MLIDIEWIFANEQLFHVLDVLRRNAGTDAHQTLIRVHFRHREIADLDVQPTTGSIDASGKNALVLDQLDPDQTDISNL